MIVGSVVVAQTLYASTKEHLYEFATLRAIGSSGLYLQTVIVAQALLSAVARFSIAILIGVLVVQLTSEFGAASRDDAEVDRCAVFIDPRDVRHFRARLDRQSPAHRSGDGVQPMSEPVMDSLSLWPASSVLWADFTIMPDRLQATALSHGKTVSRNPPSGVPATDIIEIIEVAYLSTIACVLKACHP